MSAGIDATRYKARGSFFEVLWVFLRLGVTSFGGPIAHLGYFRTEFVERRKWLDEKTYADLVALSQFLPGPASTKVGIAVRKDNPGLKAALDKAVQALVADGTYAALIKKWNLPPASSAF